MKRLIESKVTESRDTKITVAKKIADRMSKALADEVTGMDRQIMYKNVLDSLDDKEAIKQYIKDYEIGTSNADETLTQQLKSLLEELEVK